MRCGGWAPVTDGFGAGGRPSAAHRRTDESWADDPEGQARLAAFLQGLQEKGWSVGRNAQIDIRWGAGDAEQMRKQVAEMVALAPDVILASSPQVVGPAREATRR
jgi:putative ABC transport system substrate-binding protein